MRGRKQGVLPFDEVRKTVRLRFVAAKGHACCGKGEGRGGKKVRRLPGKALRVRLVVRVHGPVFWSDQVEL